MESFVVVSNLKEKINFLPLHLKWNALFVKNKKYVLVALFIIVIFVIGQTGYLLTRMGSTTQSEKTYYLASTEAFSLYSEMDKKKIAEVIGQYRKNVDKSHPLLLKLSSLCPNDISWVHIIFHENGFTLTGKTSHQSSLQLYIKKIEMLEDINVSETKTFDKKADGILFKIQGSTSKLLLENEVRKKDF